MLYNNTTTLGKFQKNTIESKQYGSSGISVPKSIYATTKIGNQFDADTMTYPEHLNYSGNVLLDVINKQHPIMHTWLLFSTLLICCLSVFVIFIS